MRHQSKIVGLIVAACALALAATPALAHEFVASRAAKLTGKSETPQAFKFGPFKITCELATAKGAAAAGSSPTFATAIKYARCTTEGKIGPKQIKLPTRFETPLAIEYHANGFVESGSELEEVEGAAVLKGGSAELKVYTGVTEEREKSRCNISWPEQTIPLKAEKKPNGEYSAATYSNETTPNEKLKKFPDGFQHFIKVSNAFKGIKYVFEGEPCEEWGAHEEEAGGGGTYTGSFPEILSGGNFEFS